MDLKVCVVFQIREGKLQLGREYFDSATLARQLGLGDSALTAMYGSLGSAA